MPLPPTRRTDHASLGPEQGTVDEDGAAMRGAENRQIQAARDMP